ncbi:hypothetical protein CAPTEDRAFT_199986 [Capitella teleta]|uniref:Sulfotransferase domain-containing protein n=1 Tax=Capitella teleta TaxID=283909 RepID=R7TLY0_CAPTE|nr:hypothetical protein CAPTEDRAFT_199986 [Capitella teleta]|eukprot:ELT92115.1 hypothetical protein CAPTEDRAFT_199986 [Capitella teleta]
MRPQLSHHHQFHASPHLTIPAADHFASSRPKESQNATRKLPDCIIIGARKGGTRAVSHFLKKNPKIITTDTEVNFFGDDTNYAKGIPYLTSLFPKIRPDQILIDKTADYFTAWSVPQRLHEYNKDIKLILVVRDPITRCISDYHFLRRFAERELLVDPDTGQIQYDFGGLYRSKYSKFFENWLKYFKLSQIHIVDGDKLANENPALQLRKIEKFLGVEAVIQEEEFYYLEDKKYWCSRTMGCLGSEKGHIFPTIDPAVETKIRQFLKPFNENFYNQTGINFGWKT